MNKDDIQIAMLDMITPVAAIMFIGAFIYGMIWLFTSVMKEDAEDTPKDRIECK